MEVKNIPMYDFPREYALNREKYIKAFDEVCLTGQFSDGEFARRFEKDFAEYLGVPFAASVNSGTDALQLSLLALGVGEGDEVIVPSATFTATPGAVLMCGAKPVFADCDEKTWQITASEIERLITPKTKAVIGVHLYGGMFDVDSVLKVTNAHGIPLIEDTAQAFGSKYNGKYAGTFGVTGCFSFYPTKNLGAFGEAGCAISSDEKLIERINALKEHDMRGNKYETLGYNMRMDGIQGAVMSIKLHDMKSFLARKREIASVYKDAVADNGLLTFQYIPENVEPSYHLFVVKTDDREKFRAYMKEKNIDTGVQYPMPCHLQRVFSDRFGTPSLPVCEELMSKCVSVPIYPYLFDEEIGQVAAALREYR